MANPRAVSKSLKATAKKIERLTDETVRAAAEFAVTEAVRVGGDMKGYALYAEVVKVSNARGTSTAVVEGVPSGFWAIKSYGRKGGYTIRSAGNGVLNLRSAPFDRAGTTAGTAARSVVVKRATSGDGRWDTVIDAVAAESPNILLKRIGKALD